MKNFNYLLVLCLLGLSVLFQACSGSKKSSEKIISTLVPISDADKSMTKNGVTVDVVALNESNVVSYSDLTCSFPVMTKGFLETEATPKSYTERNILAGFSDPPAVTFAVKITNNSGHIIKLTGSDVGLMVSGNDSRKLDVQRINNAWLLYFKQNFEFQKTVPTELTSAIQTVPIWDDNQKIIPGKTLTLYIPFDVKLNRGFNNAILSIYDIVTHVDQAGTPTERTSMDFNFREGTISIKQN